MLPRPGDLTVPLAGGPIDCYTDLPVDNQIAGLHAPDLRRDDGMLFVLAHVDDWLFVMSSSLRLVWVHQFDVGPGKLAGTVYHIE